MALTVSNKPSLHSNDFVGTMVPFSFKFNKNNVPPPTKPNGLLVANGKTIIMIGLWKVGVNASGTTSSIIFSLTNGQQICIKWRKLNTVSVPI